jgi:hypothetical protein
MQTVSHGTPDEKIGLGFDMFNTSGREEMSGEDFYRSYETLMLNWSLLMGEKLHVSREVVQEVFTQLDRRKVDRVNKQEYAGVLGR